MSKADDLLRDVVVAWDDGGDMVKELTKVRAYLNEKPHELPMPAPHPDDHGRWNRPGSPPHAAEPDQRLHRLATQVVDRYVADAAAEPVGQPDELVKALEFASRDENLPQTVRATCGRASWRIQRLSAAEPELPIPEGWEPGRPATRRVREPKQIVAAEPEKPTCKHETLQFGSGGFYVFCKTCPRRWVASKGPKDTDLDYAAGSDQLSGQERASPSAQPTKVEVPTDPTEKKIWDVFQRVGGYAIPHAWSAFRKGWKEAEYAAQPIARDDRSWLQVEIMRDAERYRFLRDHRTFHHGVSILIAADPDAPSGDVSDNAEFVDAAIDAALKSAGKE